MSPVNRFASLTGTSQTIAVAVPTGFVVCAAPWLEALTAAQIAWQQQLYRAAYEQARRRLAPLHVRLFSSMN